MKLYKKSFPEQKVNLNGEKKIFQEMVLGMLGAGLASSLLLMGGKEVVSSNFSNVIGIENQYSAEELVIYSIEGYDIETKEEKQNVQIFQVVSENEWNEIAKEESQTPVCGSKGIMIHPEQFEEYENSISNVRKQNEDSIIIVGAPINSLLEFYGMNETKQTYSESELLTIKHQLELSKKTNQEENREVKEQSLNKKNPKDDIMALYQMRELLIGNTIIEYPEINSQKGFVKK